ncbi:MAG: energy-coupling factor transporter transmembrane component T family protein [Bacillota bacterium]
MDVAFLDCLALKGTGILYRCSPASKLAMSLLFVGAVVAADNFIVLIMIGAVIMALMLLCRLPLGGMLQYTLYPAFFASVFALSAGGISAWTGLVLAKAVVAALSVLLLVGTTSFVDIFGVLRGFLPKLMVDGLFMTYRTFFILTRGMANFFRSVRLRGGYNAFRVAGNIRNLAQAMAVLFLNSWEMSERMYNIMALRGYNGCIGLPGSNRACWPRDLLPVSFGLTMLLLAVIV